MFQISKRTLPTSTRLFGLMAVAFTLSACGGSDNGASMVAPVVAPAAAPVPLANQL